MNKKTLGLTVASLLVMSAAVAKKPQKPNIIFILSDDAGYADFGFQGSKQFSTPNLDKLAKSGVVLKQLYTTDAVSGPSRAGLMSGQYQQRFGIEENPVPGLMSENGLLDGDAMGVPSNVPFISDYLSDAGYTCAAFGKWHLGSEDKYHPYFRGFDHFVGFRSGSRSYYEYKDKTKISGDKSDNRLEYGYGKYREPDRYMTGLLADEACDFIEENKDDPFFVYLAFNAVHAPLDVDPEAMKKFAHLEGNRRKLAAMTWSLDKACGQVFDKLKEEGLDENTIIVFSNDNGGPNGTNTSNYPLSGMKATFLEGGIRVPGIISYPGVIKKGSEYEHPVSFFDFLPTFTKLAGCRPLAEGATDGVDIMPYITGKTNRRPHQTLFWKCEVRGAVRDGDWKFMRFPDRPAELYNIAKDEGEHRNLADRYPNLVKKYYKMLFDWEMTLERPRWMLDRFCEKRVMEQFYEQEEYRYPREQK